MAQQILLVSKKRKKQLKNARKRRKIESGIGDKITKRGGAGEAGIQGSGDGLGESACPDSGLQSRRTKPSVVAKKPHQTMMTEQQVVYALS